MISMISFPNMFGVHSGKVRIVNKDVANRQAMKCILLSNIGELLGDPSFGSDIKSCVFELKNEFLRERFRQKASQSINKYVRGVAVEAADIHMEFLDNGNVRIWVDYYKREVGDTGTLELVVLSDGNIIAK